MIQVIEQNSLLIIKILLQGISEDEMWLKDFWKKFDIRPIKFKNKVQFKTAEFKIKQTDKCKALELIDDVIQDVKKHFSNIRKDTLIENKML